MSASVSLRQRLAAIYEVGNLERRNLPMEGVRGFAVLLVFFVHYHSMFDPWAHAERFTRAFSSFTGTIGHSGVDLFFVLSGYLIYGLIFKKPGRYMKFIERRIQRIYPTFLVVLALYLLLSILFPGQSRIPSDTLAAASYILANILLLPGLLNIQPIITVAWSLSYEFFYYLTIPSMVALLGMRRWPGIHRVLLFLVLTLCYSVYCLTVSDTHVRLIMFVSGILLFEAKYSYNLDKRLTPRADYWVLALLAATFAFMYILTARPEIMPFLPQDKKIGGAYPTLLLFVSFFVFALACFDSQSLLSKIFSWTPLRWLGNMSYSYYLIHGLTLKGIALIALPLVVAPTGISVVLYWLALPVFFFLTLFVSTLLFVLVEKRFSIQPGPVGEAHSIQGLHTATNPD
ncbi:MAG: exopolysaccharide production protein ExoZ [Blastocatellia bacterium]|nr:exopolysaccharide production protein ExoZ [Blastocatellia bacterium]